MATKARSYKKVRSVQEGEVYDSNNGLQKECVCVCFKFMYECKRIVSPWMHLFYGLSNIAFVRVYKK